MIQFSLANKQYNLGTTMTSWSPSTGRRARGQEYTLRSKTNIRGSLDLLLVGPQIPAGVRCRLGLWGEVLQCQRICYR